MKHIRFPSVEQYKNTVKRIRDRAEHNSVPLPTLTFLGTVKLHGSNASVVMDLQTKEIYAQSRDRVLSNEVDNYGFCKFVGANKAAFENLFASFPAHIGNVEPTHLVIYGEWCGGSIQQGVAIAQLTKRFVIFKMAFVFDGQTIEGNPLFIWANEQQVIETVKASGITLGTIDNISSHPSCRFEITIDFTRPELAQERLSALTNAVEAECPYGKVYGISSIGEGIVWTCHTSHDIIQTDDLLYKVKGSAHSDSKVKTLASVDVEKSNSIHEFATNVSTDHRLEKMVEKLKEEGLTVEAKNTPHFLKLVIADVQKEETDTMEASGLEPKEAFAAVSRVSRQWYLELCKKI